MINDEISFVQVWNIQQEWTVLQILGRFVLLLSECIPNSTLYDGRQKIFATFERLRHSKIFTPKVQNFRNLRRLAMTTLLSAWSENSTRTVTTGRR